MSLMNNIRTCTHLAILSPASTLSIHPAIQLTRLTPSSMDIGYRDFFFLISLHSERCTTSSIPPSLHPSLPRILDPLEGKSKLCSLYSLYILSIQ